MPGTAAARRVTEKEAARLARERYGVDAAAAGLPGEYDDNFRLTTAAGAHLVLKVMDPGRERSFVEMQCAALAHLERRAPGLVLPRVQPTTDGAPVADWRDADERPRLVWMLSYLPGRVLAEARPHTHELFASVGRLLAEVDRALADFEHPAATRELKWDLSRAAWIREHLGAIEAPERRALVERFLALFEAEVVPALPGLRRGILYGDANDHNVVVGDAAAAPRPVGLIDFGDMHRGVIASEPAIAAAYAVLDKADPLAAAAALVGGYHAGNPLEEAEIALLLPLIAARLAVSVTNSALRRRLEPDDPYVTISERPAWAALERLAAVHPRLFHYRMRDACALAPVPDAAPVLGWLDAQAERAAPVLEWDLRRTPCRVFDLGVGSLLLGADPAAAETSALTAAVFGEMDRAGVPVGVGRYGEARAFYTGDLFGALDPREERRTIHLGIDLFAAPGNVVRAPLDGVVHLLANNRARLDYGPLVILRHATGAGRTFFTLYGHMSEDTLDALRVGQPLAAGQPLGRIGTPPTNGGWPPHLHFQIILDLLDADADFPGVALASQRGLWTSLSPDPNRLLGIPAERFPAPERGPTSVLAERRARLGPNLRVSYRRPLLVARAFRQHLFDETGRAYLDAYNNVPLVGHGHPRVVGAAQRQLALLNTNTRYLHETILRYAERLTRLLPEPLRVFYFVNSGSEANELALRLARAHTGREDVVVLEHAYHGHTTTLIDVSPYKFAGPGGRGRKPWVHVAPLPDVYRGPHRRGDPEAGAKYAAGVAAIVTALRREGAGPAAFLAETLPSVAGQIVFPDGYLAAAYAHVRAAGGVCIADEVQAGFARLGSHFWGFETQRVVPDVVVLGKPIGNGFPLGAVVTSPAVAESFDAGMEFFSTFGGNPVACAAGLAVLDVLEAEGLQEHARRVGQRLLGGLRDLAARHALIGDVRGSGLFLGVELVRDRETLAPATPQTAYVVERLRELGVLTGSDGPFENVLKLRPPLCFDDRDAEVLLGALDEVLAEDLAQP